ncbi:hypothetical protein FACS1894139_09760 [Planctomycetales bacterium]|nr:hypothetical protein FACS1894107_00840 [Planctomycetales bacterium]GHT00187.1 hypothetical protein FACS1894108_11690 [Planctomycetales bacterium]GHT05614.1 hypothetical protein FACS1894139_09760 [Planctomycetales bacterium]GHV20267.1 hypothetical protein AGMMS49959_07230 [Planctomycetales bacterium]
MSKGLDTAFMRKTLLALLAIPSPSANERAVADYVVAVAAELGYALKEDGAGKGTGNCGNLYVKVPATDKTFPSLLLSAHLDTVGDLRAPQIIHDQTADRYHTDGSTILGGDDKCGVAILLALMKKIHAEKIPHGELLFVFSVAEETGLSGVEHFDPKLYAKLDGGIILDHGALNEVIVAAPTKVQINLTVRGVGGHAAFPENHINAAQVAARAVSRLPSGRLDPGTTANLGILWSGTASNIIPDTGYAEYEIRSHSEQLLDFHLTNALTIIEAAVREARVIHQSGEKNPRFSKATVDVDIETHYCRYALTDEALPVRLLSGAFKGLDFVKKPTNGGSDANVYNAKGLPTVVMGCGYYEPHGVGEYIEFAETVAAGEILLKAVTAPA